MKISVALRRLLACVVSVLVLGVALTGSLTCLAEDVDWSALIAQAKPAVVWILAETAEGTAAGSGAIISPDGYILTAAHVVEGAQRITVVVEDTREYTASVVQADYAADVAVLKISCDDLVWLALGSVGNLSYEEDVRVLGYPRPSIGVGFIPGRGYYIGLRERSSGTYIEFDASPFDQGHSGGPLINSQGEIIGVAVSIWASDDLDVTHKLAVSIDTTRKSIPLGVIPTTPSPVQPGISVPWPAGAVRVPEDISSIRGALRVAASGAEIYVAEDVYVGDLLIDKGITIICEPGTVIDGRIEIRNCEGVEIREATTTYGVLAENVVGLSLVNVAIPENGKGGGWSPVDAGGIGITLHDVASATLLGCSVEYASHGIELLNATGVVLLEHSVRQARVDVSRCSDVSFFNCTVEGTAHVWISSSTDVTFDRCTITIGSDLLFSQLKATDSANLAFLACTLGAAGLVRSTTEFRGCALLNGTSAWGGEITIEDSTVTGGLHSFPSDHSSPGVKVSIERSTLTSCHVSLSDLSDLRVADSTLVSSPISLAAGSQLEISSCTLTCQEEDSHTTGVDVDAGDGEATDVSIRDATIRGYRRGIALLGNVRIYIADCVLTENDVAIYSSCTLDLAVPQFSGQPNAMYGNGCDLVGNVPFSVRIPLREPSESVVYFPDPAYASLQEALDAVTPGGAVFLDTGEYEAGVTVGKDVVIRAADGASPVLLAKTSNAPAISVLNGAIVELEHVTLRGTGGNTAVAVNGTEIQGDRTGLVLRECLIEYWGLGLWLSLATAEVYATEFRDRGVMAFAARLTMTDCMIAGGEPSGILMYEDSWVTLHSCQISDTEYGILREYAGCDSPFFQRTGSTGGRIDGSGNRLIDVRQPICPSYPGPSWPVGFFDLD